MTTKQCLKCNHVASFEGAPPLACPECGAVYSKVEEAIRSGAPMRSRNNSTDSGFANSALPTPKAWSAISQTRGEDGLDVHAFARNMRNDSLYPAWRKIVGFFTILGYVFAVILLVAAFVVGRDSVWTLLVGFGCAAMIALAAKVGKELSLMLADLSDASVRIAARQETKP